MNHDLMTSTRRQFLARAMMGSAALFTVKGAFAEALIRTPRLTEGPFYPDQMPLDTDNDLLILSDSITPAVGEVTYFHGVVMDLQGQPVRNALVEIWQVDNKAVYIHTADSEGKDRETNFQGYGRCITGSKGEYFFRTIKPVPYPGRTPHIHVAVSLKGQRVLTTQALINGHEQNARDGLFRGVQGEDAKKALLVDFLPMDGAQAGELTARFDIVMGLTPEDPSTDRFRGRRPGGQGPGGPRRNPGA